ncbi:DUF4230 domain-containing protein [Sphingomicrobium nitratireducens]|uniref:DUF4230 domain-containing protein n=1 Tax=Sphingomicrobium nitratireducens TaxID=2964666 RepID=UPI00223EFE6C|nr:DUF4230 domain-containing protein [Sphingomicrobium nitratireducens]
MTRRRQWIGLAVAVGALLVVLLLFVLLARIEKGPDPETVAATSLEAMQAQNRLVPFSARFVSVVSSRQRRLGLFEAERTLILPGTVRYELDLSKLDARDLDWDAATRTMRVTLPPIELAGPEVDLAGAREYGEGGLLAAVTDAEEILDASNRKAAVADLRKQASGGVPMRLARDAARDAVETNFLLPLRAAGIDDVTVDARFADEGDPSTERLDVSTSYRDAMAEARRRRAARGE